MQHAEVQGDTRADDTGVSGMPADRPTATPAEGLGNQPDANTPEPKGGFLMLRCSWQRCAHRPLDEASERWSPGLISRLAAVLATVVV